MKQKEANMIKFAASLRGLLLFTSAWVSGTVMKQKGASICVCLCSGELQGIEEEKGEDSHLR